MGNTTTKIKSEGKNLKATEERKLLEMAKKALNLSKKEQKVPRDLLKAVQVLILRNQNLVKYLARGYSLFSGIDYEDLVSAGLESLPKAIDKFDLNTKNRFATYCGFWIRQYFQSYINKSQFINQTSKNKENKSNVIFYDSSYQNDDKESNSYSLIETLDDSEDKEMSNEEIRQRDIMVQINSLVNLLEERDSILLTRLMYKVSPSNLLDIYYISTEEEKKELKKNLKLGEKKDISSLQKYSLEEKKISNFPVVKKYLAMFLKKYKFSEIAKLINKSESIARRMKQENFKKLQELAKESNLGFLL